MIILGPIRKASLEIRHPSPGRCNLIPQKAGCFLSTIFSLQSLNPQPDLPSMPISSLSLRDSQLPLSLPLRSEAQVLSNQNSDWRRQSLLCFMWRGLFPGWPLSYQPMLWMHALKLTILLPSRCWGLAHHMPSTPTGPLNLPVVIEPLQGLVGSLVPPPQHPLSNTKDLIINLHAWHPVGD